MTIRRLFFALVVALGFASVLRAQSTLTNQLWRVQFDPATGGLIRIENQADPHPMNFLREPGHWERRVWVSGDASSMPAEEWGLVETAHTGLLQAAQFTNISAAACDAVYVSNTLTVTAHRELDDHGGLSETYTFQNTGLVDLELPAGSVSITAPLFDQYPDAKRSLSARCHVHLWMGGTSAWINALRMDAQPPFLGLVLTEGSLDSYSQRGGTYGDRGTFLLHPAAMTIAPGKSQTIAWRFFWHTGWDDFFTQARAQTNFIQLSAAHYTVETGEPIELTASSAASLQNAVVKVNGQTVNTERTGNNLTAKIFTSTPGELKVELFNGAQHTWLRANIVPKIADLIDARVRFIIQNQQRNATNDPLDGAYLAYDNATHQQVYAARPSDHNAGRERLAMGVLGALWYPICTNSALQATLKISLEHYNAFVTRELEDDTGTVFGTIGRKDSKRLYNYPWVAHFHLAMYRAFGDSAQLDRFVRVCRSYYAQGGAKFYAIGLPVIDGLRALTQAGRTADHDELLADFRAHADGILENGLAYPAFEVNYEQSIVAPAVEMLLELYSVTGEKKYLDGAKQQMPLLEAFAGRQPDHHLYEIAIRHWDDYWFGKLHVYGDTQPHYWSTINGIAYTLYGTATHDPQWFNRADAVLKNNLSLFSPDGSASAAHLYALTTNGHPADTNDPWANDQDWALVHCLMCQAIQTHP